MFNPQRTPPRARATSEGPMKAALSKAPPAKDGFVRRRSGELESLSTAAHSSQTTAAAAKHPEKPVAGTKANLTFTIPHASNAAPKVKELFAESKRIVEAKAKIKETKKKMDENTNMKREVKTAIHECLELLIRLLKESEDDKGKGQIQIEKSEVETGNKTEKKEEVRKMVKVIEKNNTLLKENMEEMGRLREVIVNQQEMGRGSYANVVAGPPRVKQVAGTPVHSVVVSSEVESDTSEQVLEKIRVVVNAREEGIKIDNIRKAKDCKVIIGCETREEIGRVKEKLKTAGKSLSVVEMTNKDPLVILRDVMRYNKDEQVVEGLRVQNRDMFEGIEPENNRIEVKFRKRTRNPLTEHIVLKVSPKIWTRMTEAGKVHIDLQRVKVADHSPLIQCARCLGYGHGKRFCQDPVDVCSHCGGPHLRSECTRLAEGSLPRCVNCVGAKLERVDHNAFSEECPVRRRWDALARSTVQYC